jgi:L-tartrate/succinate antiporter
VSAITTDGTVASSKGWWRAAAPLSLAVLVALLPVPTGLSGEAWQYFALFVGVIAALITDPLPGAVVGLIGITAASVLRLVAPTPTESIRWGLGGFADGTVWLMFVAFVFALGYQKTGLGRRIALVLVRTLGRRTLGLGYAIALTDLVLAPFVPSNTARSGGIVFPIVESIPALYGSAPGPTARRIGGYVMWTALAATCVTSSMFVTALAPNLLAAAFMRDIAGLEVTWLGWLEGILPVSLGLFAVLPLLVYWIYPPGVKRSDEVPRWAQAELAKMGTMSLQEVTMAVLALLALVLWIFAGRWVNATAVALVSLCLMLLTRVIRWEDVLGYGRAWSYLVWFATLVTLADGLGRVGFLRWFAAATAASLAGFSTTTQVALIVTVFYVAHYMFASLTAHATALLPVFLAAAVAVPGLPVAVIAFGLSYSLGLMGIMTPYATGSAPLYYGSGYIGHGEFWTLGLVFGAIYLGALLAIGLPYLGRLHP